MKTKLLFLVISLLMFTVSCSNNEPVPINYGSDECSLCKMSISDSRFGSELVTEKGKVYKFDSIECLADYSTKNDKEKTASNYVTDFKTQKLISIKNAFFLRSDNLRSPMGLFLSAYSSQKNLEEMKSKYEGEVLSWIELKGYVAKEWQ